ncbi:hypothetical protein CDAR_371991 [Caerostris darwini]|uniref:Uncharacterized protein n=1 Tax=Caerostris darwini TaxID=1538125 RepID=A0AAV4VZL8_9ARAC|nr:hypothetical protein CDAR_371991 [Caerostris darwini]
MHHLTDVHCFQILDKTNLASFLNGLDQAPPRWEINFSLLNHSVGNLQVKPIAISCWNFSFGFPVSFRAKGFQTFVYRQFIITTTSITTIITIKITTTGMTEGTNLMRSSVEGK